MLNFQSLTIDNKKQLDSYLKLNPSMNCDYCFANLVAWQRKFNTVFAIFNDTLFLRFEDGDETFFMMPLGAMPLREAIDILQQEADNQNVELQIKPVSTAHIALFEKDFPQKFVFIEERDNFEYVYLSEKLINLHGKKLQAKRNHINRFKAENPDWKFAELCQKADFEACYRLLHEWETERDMIDSDACYDILASHLMLENFAELRLQGGMICAAGKIVAFAVGEKLNDNCFVIHIEKANHNINGAYAIINQQMAEYFASNYLYINREEDLGLENLRKAKLSYYPEILLEEGTVRIEKKSVS